MGTCSNRKPVKQYVPYSGDTVPSYKSFLVSTMSIYNCTTKLVQNLPFTLVTTVSRTDSSGRGPKPSVRTVNNAIPDEATTRSTSPYHQSELCAAARAAGGASADLAAPMHGQPAVDSHTGRATTRLAMTAPPSSSRTKNLGKRSRGGNRTPRSTSSTASPAKNRAGLVFGRVDSGSGHRSDSIPAKSRRVSDPDAEPVVTSQLSVRRPEVCAGLAVGCNDFSGDVLTQVAGGAQAVFGRPLVPRPSSPRAQGECHPW